MKKKENIDRKTESRLDKILQNWINFVFIYASFPCINLSKIRWGTIKPESIENLINEDDKYENFIKILRQEINEFILPKKQEQEIRSKERKNNKINEQFIKEGKKEGEKEFLSQMEKLEDTNKITRTAINLQRRRVTDLLDKRYKYKMKFEFMCLVSMTLGYEDWIDFCKKHQKINYADTVNVELLKEGEEVFIGEELFHFIRLKYKGNYEFEVVEYLPYHYNVTEYISNIILPGDTFKADQFGNHPLYLNELGYYPDKTGIAFFPPGQKTPFPIELLNCYNELIPNNITPSGLNDKYKEVTIAKLEESAYLQENEHYYFLKLKELVTLKFLLYTNKAYKKIDSALSEAFRKVFQPDRLKHRPSIYILDRVCEKLNYKDWKDFCDKTGEFYDPEKVDIKKLALEEEFIIGWPKSHFVKLKFKGSNKFEIVDFDESVEFLERGDIIYTDGFTVEFLKNGITMAYFCKNGDERGIGILK